MRKPQVSRLLKGLRFIRTTVRSGWDTWVNATKILYQQRPVKIIGRATALNTKIDQATYHFRLQRTRTYACRKYRSSILSGPPPCFVTKTLPTTQVSCSGRRLAYSYSAVLREKVALSSTLFGVTLQAQSSICGSHDSIKTVPAGSGAPTWRQPVPWVCHTGRQRQEGRRVLFPWKHRGLHLPKASKRRHKKRPRVQRLLLPTCDSSPWTSLLSHRSQPRLSSVHRCGCQRGGKQNLHLRGGKATLPLPVNVSVLLLQAPSPIQNWEPVRPKSLARKLWKDQEAQISFHSIFAVILLRPAGSSFSHVFCWLGRIVKKMTKLTIWGLNNSVGGNAGQTCMLEGLLSNFVSECRRTDGKLILRAECNVHSLTCSLPCQAWYYSFSRSENWVVELSLINQITKAGGEIKTPKQTLLLLLPGRLVNRI